VKLFIRLAIAITLILGGLTYNVMRAHGPSVPPDPWEGSPEGCYSNTVVMRKGASSFRWGSTHGRLSMAHLSGQDQRLLASQ
jgi:hypothetical protein